MKTYSILRFAMAVLAVGGLAMMPLGSPPVHATGPWYVALSGDDANSCLSPAAPCATINGAIAKASPDDTIYVAAEVHAGAGKVLIDKNATLSGGWDASFAAQTGYTTQDCLSSYRGIELGDGISATVERFVVQNCTNSGIFVYFGSLTLNKSAVTGCRGTILQAELGGGIMVWSGSLVLNDSAVGHNMASSGGGLWIRGDAIINNSTVGSNRAVSGGGIVLDQGTLTLNSTTIADNAATWSGGVVRDVAATAVWARNSIIAANRGFGPDCVGGLISLGYNLIGDDYQCQLTPGVGDLINVAPRLGPLMGSPGYHPVWADSLAVNAGDPAGCQGSNGLLTADQRGVPRVGRCDIGAYEYRPPDPAASIVALGTMPQRTPPSSTFWHQLQAAVLDDVGSPVPGVSVTFAAPSTGASGTFADTGTLTTTAVTDDSGVAVAAALTANAISSAITGTYPVTATATGLVASASFALANVGWYVAPGGSDENVCTTPAAACASLAGATQKGAFKPGDTVLVATGTYSESVVLSRDMRLLGGWDQAFAIQEDLSTLDGQGMRVVKVNWDVAAMMKGFIVTNGQVGYDDGAGINNAGELVLATTRIISNGVAGYGGGIHNEGFLTANDCDISGNGAYWGAGIHNVGMMTLNNSLVSGNDGWGILTGLGDMTINSTAVVGNKTGIFWEGGRLAVNNSTVSGNVTDFSGGGIHCQAPGQGIISLYNTTVSNNRAGYGPWVDQVGGGLFGCGHPGAVMVLTNSIVAGNSAPAGPDCAGPVQSIGYNLIGDTSGCDFAAGAGDLLNANPKLFALAGWPGYHPLRPGSPAIDAGNPAGCTDHLGNPLLTDERGIPRPLDGDGDGSAICDMGAYEVDPEHPIIQVFLPIITRSY